MKNKFKLFCTFMICLIFLTLVNTNSPQPSADTTINEGVIMPTGAYIDSYPDAYNFHYYLGNSSNNAVHMKYTFRTYTNCTLEYVIVSQYISDYYKDDGTGRTGGFAGPGNYTDNKAYYNLRYGESTGEYNAGCDDSNGYKDYTLRVVPTDNVFKNVDSSTGTAKSVDLPVDDDDFKFYISAAYKLTGIFELENGTKMMVENYINSAPGFNSMDLNISNSTQSATVELPDPEKTTEKISKYEEYTNVMNAWNVFQKINEYPTDSINYAPNQQSPDGSIKSWDYYSRQSQTAKDFLGKDDNGNSRFDRVYSSENTQVPTVLQVYPGASNIASWFPTDGLSDFKVSSIDLKESTIGTTKGSSPSYDSFIVESISIDDFNKEPSKYTDPNKYKVIMFGTFDRNNNKDISEDAVGYLENYSGAGGGIILGHDTAYEEHPQFMRLAQDLGLLDGFMSSANLPSMNGGDLTQPHWYNGKPFSLGGGKGLWTSNDAIYRSDASDWSCLTGTYLIKVSDTGNSETDYKVPGECVGTDPDDPKYWSLVTLKSDSSLIYPNKIKYLVDSDKYADEKILRVPPCHTTSQVLANGTVIDYKFSDITYCTISNTQYHKYSDGILKNNNFYLAHNKVGNVYMFQTGHSNGLASMQEKQLWADVIYKLCNRDNSTASRDVNLKLGDYNPPYLKNSPIVNNQNKLFINVEDESSGNAFVPNYTDVAKTTSAVSYSNNYRFSAGNKGYAYFFSDDDFGVGDLDSISSKEDQDKYTSGDFETYTFDSWSKFNYKSKNQASNLFSSSKVVKDKIDTASIDLNENTNGAKYAYICLFDNSTRMATNKADLDSLDYDGLAGELTLQNEDSSFDERLHDEWSSNSDLNWDLIKKYGNRTVIRIKLDVNKVTTHITNSHYIDDSSPNRFWTNKSNRDDSIATTGDEKITTVTKFPKNADKNAQKIIAIGDSSTPSASTDNAKAWIDPESNSKEIVDTDLVKNIKVVKSESTGDFITYTVEWTIAGKHFSNSNINTLFYNYAYIDSYNPVSNGCQENFTVDIKPPRISSKPDSPSKYQIKVSDSDNTKGELYQSGIKSIVVNLINSDGDKEETSCYFTREGNKRVNEKILTLEQDLTDYSKIEVITEDNVGNKAESLIPLANESKETNSGEIHASLKNWYYSSGSHNKWVSGRNNPSTINTSNSAYVSIDDPTYNLLRNENYAAQMVKFKTIQGGYSIDEEDELDTDKYDGYSEASLIFNTSVGTFNPGAYECYDTLGGELKLGTLKNNSNKYIKISKGAKVTNEYESSKDNLDKFTYFNTIPLTGLKDFVGNKISMNILNKQTISATQECHYYTYTEKDGIITPAWDEYEEETGKFIKHHEAVPGKIKVETKNNKTVRFTENESISSSTTLEDTLSVDATKPTIRVSKTGRYTNKVTIKDLDTNKKTDGASGIHKIKLGLSNSSTASIDSCKSAFDGSNEYLQNSGTKSYVDCWKGQSPKDYENTVNVSPVHELTFDLDCFSSDNVPDYLHKKVDTDKYTVYKYLIYEIEDNVGNKITGSKDLKPTTVTAQITEDGQDPNSYPEDNTPDKPKSEIPVNPIGPKNPLFNENVSINAHPTEITDPKDNSKKRKIVDVEVNATITNPTPGFSPKLEIYGYGKNDEYRKPIDFSNLIDKSNKNEMSKFGERPLTKDTYSEIYVDDTYNTSEKPTAHVDIDSSSSLLKFKELEDPKLPYFFEVYTKTCEDEDWIKEVDTVHPLYFASGYDHDRIVIYKVDGDHSEPNDYWKKNPVLSGNYYGTGSGEGLVDISNLRTGWYKAELIMYDFNGNPSGKEELWFYQNQPASYTPFNVSISAVKDVDWEGDVRFNYKETKVPSVPINDLQKDKDTKTNPNDTVDKDVEINLDSNRRPGSFVSDTGDSDYYPLGLNFGANGDSLKKIDWTNSDKTSYNKPKEGDTDKGNPIAKGYAVNWNFSKENKQQLNSLSLNYSYTTTSGDSLTIYSSDGSTKLTDDPSNGLYVDSQELTQTQLDALNSSLDNSDSLNGYLKPPSFDPNKSMYTQIPVKHYLPENFVAKTSSGSVYNGVVIVTVTFKATISQGTMASSTADQSIDLYAIYQGETALDDVTLDRQR